MSDAEMAGEPGGQCAPSCVRHKMSARLKCYSVLTIGRRTGLRCPLHQLVGESSDALVGDGGQGEGVLRVWFQTLHRVRVPGPEAQFFL